MRRHRALRCAAQGIRGSLPDLAASIYQCIHRKDGRVLDEASEKLGAIRRQRQENLKSLRLAMEDWARSMHRKGAAERSQVLHTSDPGHTRSTAAQPCEAMPRDCVVPEAGHGGVAVPDSAEAVAAETRRYTPSARALIRCFPLQSVQEVSRIACSSSRDAEQRCLARAAGVPQGGV